MKKLLILVLSLVFVSCAKDTVEPNVTGKVAFTIFAENADGTTSRLGGVLLTTTPPSISLRTDGNGYLESRDIPIGTVTVRAEKAGYETRTVNINVRRYDWNIVNIVLKEVEEAESQSNAVSANINRVYNYVQDDSNYVQVDYEITNNSNSITVPEYEVYFRIYAADEIFTEEITGTDLQPQQKTFGTFDRLTFQNPSDSVVVFDIWTPDN
ncbi:hypothetical protein AB2B38_001815 [Balneola sp. MJW-20]|uniref:hypothetical protein n=1 Tax=Gracilimonas aurantiaca TaxID=3234185 RepID=UPI003465CD3E